MGKIGDATWEEGLQRDVSSTLSKKKGRDDSARVLSLAPRPKYSKPVHLGELGVDESSVELQLKPNRRCWLYLIIALSENYPTLATNSLSQIFAIADRPPENMSDKDK